MGYPIKQSQTARPLIFLMVDSADHITPKTGLSPTVTLSKNGGSLASPAGAVSEIGQGLYKVAANATDANTLGPLVLHATATGADPSDTLFEVVAYDPESATSLGLSNLDAAISSRLAPTTSGRTLDVSAGGEAGVDWANVGSPTTVLNLLGTTVKTATDVETDTQDIQSRLPAALVGGRMDSYIGAVLDGVLTSAKFAAGAFDAVWSVTTRTLSSFGTLASDVWAVTVRTITGGSLTTAPPTAAAIADAVWDETTSGHTTTGTYGGRIVRAANSNVEVQITGSNHIAADVHAFQPAVIDAASIATNAITAAKLAADASAEIADAVWDETTSGHQTAGTTGKALTDAGSGGGGGGGGTIVIERQIRLSLDTANPIAEPFALMQGDVYTLKAYITDYNGDPVPLTGYTLTASATNTLGTEIDAPTVTAYDAALGIVEIAITTDLTAAALAKGYLSVKFTDGTNTYITVPTEISVGAR